MDIKNIGIQVAKSGLIGLGILELGIVSIVASIPLTERQVSINQVPYFVSRTSVGTYDIRNNSYKNILRDQYKPFLQTDIYGKLLKYDLSKKAEPVTEKDIEFVNQAILEYNK